MGCDSIFTLSYVRTTERGRDPRSVFDWLRELSSFSKANQTEQAKQRDARGRWFGNRGGSGRCRLAKVLCER